jgi:hypothetical protein
MVYLEEFSIKCYINEFLLLLFLFLFYDIGKSKSSCLK